MPVVTGADLGEIHSCHRRTHRPSSSSPWARRSAADCAPGEAGRAVSESGSRAAVDMIRAHDRQLPGATRGDLSPHQGSGLAGALTRGPCSHPNGYATSPIIKSEPEPRDGS